VVHPDRRVYGADGRRGVRAAWRSSRATSNAGTRRTRMTLADVVLTYLWVGVTLYALFGGADFGAGFWDLMAGSSPRGDAQRTRIEKSIGPVWEANHVWLIFVLVVLWTAFPAVFAAMASTLYIPFT